MCPWWGVNICKFSIQSLTPFLTFKWQIPDSSHIMFFHSGYMLATCYKHEFSIAYTLIFHVGVNKDDNGKIHVSNILRNIYCACTPHWLYMRITWYKNSNWHNLPFFLLRMMQSIFLYIHECSYCHWWWVEWLGILKWIQNQYLFYCSIQFERYLLSYSIIFIYENIFWFQTMTLRNSWLWNIAHGKKSR